MSLVSNILVEIKRSVKIAIPLILDEIGFVLSGVFITIIFSDLGSSFLATHALVWSIFGSSPVL
jgi:Na+-driven multidrug efflux pump